MLAYEIVFPKSSIFFYIHVRLETLTPRLTLENVYDLAKYNSTVVFVNVNK